MNNISSAADIIVRAAFDQRHGAAVSGRRIHAGKQGTTPKGSSQPQCARVPRILQVAQMAEISQMKSQFSADMNVIASCASMGFDALNTRMVETSDILQRVVTLLTMK